MNLFSKIGSLFTREEPRVDEALQRQLEARGISEVSPQAVQEARQTRMPEQMSRPQMTLAPIEREQERSTLFSEFTPPSPRQQRSLDAEAAFQSAINPTRERLQERREGAVQGAKEFATGAATFGRSVGAQILDTIPSAIDFAAKNLEESGIYNPEFLFGKDYEPPIQVSKYTSELVDLTEKIKQTPGNYYKPSKEFEQAPIQERFLNPNLWSETVQVYGPSITASIAEYIIYKGKAPTVDTGSKILNAVANVNKADLIIGASVANEVAREAESLGVERRKALNYGMIPGVTTMLIGGLTEKSILESLQKETIETASRGLIRSIVTKGKDIIKSGATEGLQELIEEESTIFANRLYRDVTSSEARERRLESFGVGAFAGSAMKTGETVLNSQQDFEAVGKIIGREIAKQEFSFGLSIKEVDNDFEAQAILRIPEDQRTEVQQRRLEDYQARVAKSGNVEFLDAEADAEYLEYLARERAQVEQELQVQREFTDSQMESGYQDFVDIISSPVLRNPKAKESLLSGDAEQFKREAVRLGLVEDAVEADSILYSQDQNVSEVFDAYIDRVRNEEPTLVMSREEARKLGYEGTFEARRMQMERTLDSLDTKEQDALVSLAESITKDGGGRKYLIDIMAETSPSEVRETMLRATDVARAEGASRAEIARVLRKVESINRAARASETKRAIRETTKQPISKMVRMREKTLLKNRLKNIARGAREGALEERRVTEQKRRAIRDYINDSPLTVDQKRRLLSRASTMSVDSNTDLTKLLQDIDSKIDTTVEKTLATSYAEKVAKLAQDYTVKPPKGEQMPTGRARQLEADTQALVNKLFDKEARTGIFAYEVVTDADGKKTIDTTKARERMEEIKDTLARNAVKENEQFRTLTDFDRAKLKLENEALLLAGLINESGQVRKREAAKHGPDIIAKFFNEMKQVIDGSRTNVLREAFNDTSEFELSEGSANQGMIDRGDRRNYAASKKSLFEKIQSRTQKYFGSIETIKSFLQKITSLEDIKDNLFVNTTIYKKFYTPMVDGWEKSVTYDVSKKTLLRQAIGDIWGLFDGNKIQKEKAFNKFKKEYMTKNSLGTFTFNPDPRGRTSTKELKFSGGDLVYIYNALRQPVFEKSLRYHYGWTDAVINKVKERVRSNPRLKEYADWLVDFGYTDLSEDVGAMYEKETGIPFPTVNEYTYVETEKPVGSELDESEAQLAGAIGTFNMSQTISRQDPEVLEAAGALPKIKFVSADQAYLKYVKDAGAYIYMTEPMRNWQRLMTGDFGKRLKEEWGNEAYAVLRDGLQDVIKVQNRADPRGMELLDTLTGRFARTTLMANLTQLPKQMTSASFWINQGFSYGVSKDMAKYSLTYLKELTNGKAVISEMQEGLGALKIRGKISTININADELSRIQTNLNDVLELGLGRSAESFLNKPVEWGDKFGVYSGGVPFYLAMKDKLRRENPDMSDAEVKERALVQFAEAAQSIQQSKRNIDRSRLERRGGPLVRAYMLFDGTVLQIYRKELEGLRELKQARMLMQKGKKKQAYKVARRGAANIALAHFNFMLFQWVSQAFRGIFDDDNEDEAALARAAILGPFGSLPIIGPFIETAVRNFTGDDTFGTWYESFSSITGIQGTEDLGKGINMAIESIVEIAVNNGTIEEEYDNIVKGFASVFEVFLGRGYPMTNVVETIERAMGELSEGRMNLINVAYSDYARGIDVRRETFEDAKADDVREIKQMYEDGRISKEEANRLGNKAIKDLEDDFVDKIANEMINDTTSSREALNLLEDRIADGELPKELGQRVVDEYVKWLNGPEDSQRKEQLREVNSRTGLQQAAEILEGLTKNPGGVGEVFRDVGNIVRAGLVEGEILYKSDDGIVRLVRMPQSESEALKRELKAKPGEELDHIIPLQLGGSNREGNLRVVPRQLNRDYSYIENQVVSLVKAKRMSNSEARRFIKAMKDGDITLERAQEIMDAAKLR